MRLTARPDLRDLHKTPRPITLSPKWGCSSNGRAADSHSAGREIDTFQPHVPFFITYGTLQLIVHIFFSGLTRILLDSFLVTISVDSACLFVVMFIRLVFSSLASSFHVRFAVFLFHQWSRVLSINTLVFPAAANIYLHTLFLRVSSPLNPSGMIGVVRNRTTLKDP